MIIEPRTAEVFSAYADTLIPGNADWPTPSQIGVLDYAEQAVTRSNSVKASVLFTMQEAEAHAGRLRQVSFVELGETERVEVLKTIEQQHPLHFGAVREIVYEAYYTSAPVRIAIESRTGFRPRAALDGIGAATFDDVLMKLADVAERPKRVRDVPK